MSDRKRPTELEQTLKRPVLGIGLRATRAFDQARRAGAEKPAGHVFPRRAVADDLRDVVRVEDRLRPLGHRLEHADHVHVLVTLFVLPLAIRLPCQADQRSAIVNP